MSQAQAKEIDSEISSLKSSLSPHPGIDLIGVEIVSSTGGIAIRLELHDEIIAPGGRRRRQRDVDRILLAIDLDGIIGELCAGASSVPDHAMPGICSEPAARNAGRMPAMSAGPGIRIPVVPLAVG